jgi:hypothetical protein
MPSMNRTRARVGLCGNELRLIFIGFLPQAQGNEQFKIANYAGAVECYTRVCVVSP